MSTETMALTHENVEKVLDELRPFLMADGGNVEVVELDGPIVKVRLQGACGSCPSSTMTLKMGIERKMREAIPEVSEVVQCSEQQPEDGFRQEKKTSPPTAIFESELRFSGLGTYFFNSIHSPANTLL